MFLTSPFFKMIPILSLNFKQKLFGINQMKFRGRGEGLHALGDHPHL